MTNRLVPLSGAQDLFMRLKKSVPPEARHAAIERIRNLLAPEPRRDSRLPEPEIDNWIRIGAFTLGGLFCGSVIWAALAPISSAALGQGTIKVETNRKTVQHLEGGILRDILVREGQAVHRGDILFRLDSVDADADRDSLQGQLAVLKAREARLNAQRNQASDMPPVPAADLAREPRYKAALQGQKRIFEEQNESIGKQIEVWQRRKDQFYAQISATQGHMKSLQAQRPLLEEEMQDARNLLERGYGLKPRVLSLERQVEGIKGEIATDEGKILSLKDQVSEAETQILSITAAQSKQIAEELQEVEAKINETQDQLKKSVARQGRHDVTAPVDGVAMNLRSFTSGGVISAGGALVDIVPSGEKLVIEVRIAPTDIDVVRPSLDASVRLVAYKQRTTPTLSGKVTRISADAMTEDRSGASYYVASVEVPADQLARASHVRLYPGMPVEVAIITGQRTLLSYLMQPLTDSMSRSFREE